jgi:hypothetical protein
MGRPPSVGLPAYSGSRKISSGARMPGRHSGNTVDDRLRDAAIGIASVRLEGGLAVGSCGDDAVADLLFRRGRLTSRTMGR